MESNEVVAAELDAAIVEVDRLAHTVGELLVLSRAGERRMAGTALDLDDLADAAADRWRAAAAEHGIDLVCRHAGGGGAWAAPADAERALDVLIENALAYSPIGSTVEVVSATGRIEVRDHGPGLAGDEGEAVFERFHRGRAGLSGPPGSGLGLAIARELARGWNGEVTLENRDGGGAIATLSLSSSSGGATGGASALPALNPAPSSVPSP